MTATRPMSAVFAAGLAAIGEAARPSVRLLPVDATGPAAGAAQELPQLVAVLTGSVSEAAERIRRMHRELGITYFTFNKTPDTSWETLEKLIAAVK